MHSPYTDSKDSLVLRVSLPSSRYDALRKEDGNDAMHGELSVTAALEKLFPPKPVGDVDGEPMVSVATTDHLSKLDVIHLQEELEKRCSAARARAFGVDDTREHLYDDCFNEIIRQVAVGCPERGLLLAQLRDEFRETNESYDVLFESASQFGARKTIERDLKRTMQRDLETLLKEVAVLENKVNEVKAKYDGLEKRFIERRAGEEKRHQEEVQFLKKGNLQLTNEIKRLTN